MAEDVLTLRRTRPVQGQPVAVAVEWNGQPLGTLEFPFVGWIKMQKLLQKGAELDGREGHLLGVKLNIKGTTEDPKQPQLIVAAPITAISVEQDDLEAEDALAIAEIEAQAQSASEGHGATHTEQLVRSLRGGE